MKQYYIAIDDDSNIFEMSDNKELLKTKFPDLNIEKCSKRMAIAHFIDGVDTDYLQCEKQDDCYFLIQEIEVERQKMLLHNQIKKLAENAGIIFGFTDD